MSPPAIVAGRLRTGGQIRNRGKVRTRVDQAAGPEPRVTLTDLRAPEPSTYTTVI